MSRKVFMKGNEAAAEGAICGGCRFFFGYPITPQNEIPEYMARHLPEVGGTYVQAESEVAAINMVFGAAAAGGRAMTSSSGPGISLMQEGISYLTGSEVPCVIINIVRGGPGLGNIATAQCDYFLATRGSGHGDGRSLVFAPSTVQELHDWTAQAFGLAEKYRTPVMILGEAILGQMMKPVELRERRPPPDPTSRPWAIGGVRGDRPRRLITSLYARLEDLEAKNRELEARYDQARREEVYWDEHGADDPQIAVVAYGVVARVCRTAIDRVGERGVRARLLRPISLFPFPEAPLRALSEQVEHVLVVETSLGQLVEDVRLAVEGRAPVSLLTRVGGVMITPEEVQGRLEALNQGSVGGA